jgi:hypothetical protein
MQKSGNLLIAAGVMVTFTGIAGAIIYFARARFITPELALLMLVALLGMYFGFGVLILVYRFVRGLE